MNDDDAPASSVWRLSFGGAPRGLKPGAASAGIGTPGSTLTAPAAPSLPAPAAASGSAALLLAAGAGRPGGEDSANTLLFGGSQPSKNKPASKLICKLLLVWVSVVAAATIVALALANGETRQQAAEAAPSAGPGATTRHHGNASDANATKRIALNGGFVCDADGQWRAAPGGLTCHQNLTAVLCPSGDPLSGRKHHDTCQPGRFNEECTLSCDEGYDASGVEPFVCSADDRWVGGSITCSPVECPAEPPAPHAKSCACGHYDPDHSSTCSPNCEHGFANIGTGDGSYTWH